MPELYGTDTPPDERGAGRHAAAVVSNHPPTPALVLTPAPTRITPMQAAMVTLSTLSLQTSPRRSVRQLRSRLRCMWLARPGVQSVRIPATNYGVPGAEGLVLDESTLSTRPAPAVTRCGWVR